MKNFKRILSFALVLLMVVGALAYAPADTKAANTDYNQVKIVDDIKAGGQFVLVAEYDGKYYALNTVASGKELGVEVTVANGKVTGDALPVWTVAA